MAWNVKPISRRLTMREDRLQTRSLHWLARATLNGLILQMDGTKFEFLLARVLYSTCSSPAKGWKSIVLGRHIDVALLGPFRVHEGVKIKCKAYSFSIRIWPLGWMICRCSTSVSYFLWTMVYRFMQQRLLIISSRLWVLSLCCMGSFFVGFWDIDSALIRNIFDHPFLL